MDLFKGLNDKQKEAVEATEGPVMVIAGAGSGKTKVLTHRIAHIINDLGIPLSNVLAVTFTNKAALEMKTRVSNLLSIDTKNMWISTFHSFGAKILRKEIKHLGYKSSFNILDTDDSLKEIKLLCKENNFEIFTPKELQVFISNYKNEVSIGVPERLLSDFHMMYEIYEKHLFNNNLLDFDDLIVKTLTLFRNHPIIIEKYSSMFNYIMVDEFQDTNKTQYELVLLLASVHQNIFIVGDQDQSIYSFRGALVTNIDQFRSHYKKTKLILLEQNYRSTQTILDAANKIIKNNVNRIEKNLFTNNNKGEELTIKCLDTSYGEANYISRQIAQLVSCGYKYQDIAIIYRQNSLSRLYEDEFIKKNIPYTIYGGLSYFSRKEVKDIIAYIKLICSNDNFALRRIINVPKRGVGAASLKILENNAKDNNCSLYEILNSNCLSAKLNIEMNKLKENIDYLRSIINEIDLADLVKEVIKIFKYDKMLESLDEEDRLDNILELKSVFLDISEFYEGSNIEKLEEFLFDLALKTDTDNVKDDNKVKLMTFHQAKGLEFKIVFMTAMEDGIFPSPRVFTQQEVEEEYRICYVGITRAMEKLYFTHCELRRLYGKDIYCSPSNFLNELTKQKQKNISYYNNTVDNDFKIGDIIEHKSWGRGVVVLTVEDKVEIAFDISIGKKTLKAGHPSYSKIKE